MYYACTKSAIPSRVAYSSLLNINLKVSKKKLNMSRP